MTQTTPRRRQGRASGIWQPDALRLQLAAIGGNEPAGGVFAVEWVRPDGGPGTLHHATHRPESIVEAIQGLGRRNDVRVRSAPRSHRHGGPFERCWCLHVECATEAAVRALRSWPIVPSIVLATGEQLTAVWSLREPVDPMRALAANRVLAVALGATAPTEPIPQLRLAGTSDHSTDPPTPIVATSITVKSYTAEQVVASTSAAA